MSAKLRPFLLLCLGLGFAAAKAAASAPADTPADHFEKRVRPLLAAHCNKCHGADKQKGGLRLDSAAAVARGGDTGPAVVPGNPEESLLIRAVRQTGNPKMPPDGKLKEQEIADLAAWVKAGAVWHGGPTPPVKEAAAADVSLAPDDPALAKHLQAWFRADSLPLEDGKPVQVWPDGSGRGRDLAATAGVRTGGVGKAPLFVAASTVNRHPAVRFGREAGLAGSPHHVVDVRGDAALTIVLVLNLEANDAVPPFDGIVGVGNPANLGGDPGRPLAALVQINRHGGNDHQLELAGGWGHDATLGPGSFRPLYNRPVLLTVTKAPGPMKTTTRFFLDGAAAEERPLQRSVGGRDTVPDVRHRDDIGLYMGKALGWCGSFRGDVAEVIVYNKVLTDAERAGVEEHLAAKYAFVLPSMLRRSAATFTAEQKAFWAFQPVKDVAPPAVKAADWPTSPIDRFILAALEQKSLSPAPRADRRTLLRRVTVDLTGLPPTPQEMDAFLADNSADAFAKVVDRLLASPHYGERWGRHWLDVARYADTTANDANAIMRYAYRYRDYVVDAFNRDKPYDQFVVEQLAGDLLPPTPDLSRTAERVIATGFLMVGPKALAETDKEQTLLDIADEQIDVTGRAFLGLTVSCARCHDHKFDPIPTADYYSLAGIFRGTEVLRDRAPNASMWQEWPLLQLPGEKPVMVMAPKEGLPTNLRVHLRGNRSTLGPTAPRRFLQVLAGEGHAPLTTTQSGRLELAKWVASRDNPLTARVLVNRLWQHHFGTGLVATADNFGARGERPSHPQLLDWLAARFAAGGWSVKAVHRLMLLSSTYQMAGTPDARALAVDPGNRLLWRMPRRRLEAEAVRDGLLAVSGQLDRAVGGNEAVEQVFQAGEVIDGKRGFVVNRVQGNHACYNSRRRSIYLPVIRNALPEALVLFDAADPYAVAAVRSETTVPSQALFLLNSPFVREQALHFARSLLADAKGEDGDRLRSAYARALGRPPTAEELADAAAFLRDHAARARANGRPEADARLAAWQSYCQLLFCMNEFLYLD
jgi:cytochrome c553